ncbi:hypothetical protein ACE1B6_05415 [Aerosakkonemataceae cyanobacterium BLCC-F154]|uniref:Uncharacterized protein n=1 Tax=Floridaenema fluviatile BLCC-F154 TaxID=3153640 RepID=A0ABV4Y7G1_9CYAN
MASISNQTLTLTDMVENGVNMVIVEIKYDVNFKLHEYFLQTLGFQFQETIQILGVDVGNVVDKILLDKFMPVQDITVPPGGGTVSRKRTGKVTRAFLQEDSAPGDADEIRCSIQILPVAAREFTPVVSIAG